MTRDLKSSALIRLVQKFVLTYILNPTERFLILELRKSLYWRDLSNHGAQKRCLTDFEVLKL